ncbi:MAG: enoyl-CoA hydratase-related protein [Syntrophaceae bacterium]
MEYKNILFEVAEGIATITINRPKALNALNSDVMAELNDAGIRCKTDEAIKVVILTGAGEKSFVAGADISQMAELRPQQAMDFMEAGIETFRSFEILPKPVIAAINGFALGGGVELAMSCDIRLASENARFGQPEILIGLIPGWGGTQRLARLVGMGRAKELIMAGGQIDAKRAYEIGLVNQVYPLDQLIPEARKLAKKMEGLPGFALKMAKHAINFGYDVSMDTAMRLETQCCSQCFSTDDQKEGMKAFLEKRKPVFKGK